MNEAFENSIPSDPLAALPPVDCAIAKKRFSSAGLSCIVLMVAAMALQSLLLVPIYFVDALAESGLYMAMASYLPMFAVGYPVSMAVLRQAPKGRLRKQKMSLKGLFVCLLMSLGLMYAGNYIGIGVNALLSWISGVPTANPLENMVDSSGVLERFVFMVIAAPLWEEFFFRKQMIDRLHRYGEAVSILVSALLFGLIHGNLSQFFYAFLLGALFAYIYTRTGIIWYTIILHAVINLLGGIIAPLVAPILTLEPELLLAQSGWDILLYLLATLYSMLLLAGFVAGIVILIRRRRSFRMLPTEAEIPRGLRAKTAFGSGGMILTVVILGLLTIGQSLALMLLI